MKFKLSYTISRLDIHSKDILKFELSSNSENIQLLLRAPTHDERSKGFKSFNAFLDIFTDIQPSKNSRPVFDAFLDGRRPPAGEKAKSAVDMIYREGPSYGLEYYPGPFVSFINMVQGKLSTAGDSLVKILRWRYAQEGPPLPIGIIGLFCSKNNGETWHPIPGNYSIINVTPPHSVLDTKEINVNEISASIKSDSQEPVGHELLRESKELQHTSPRSAVLIAVSAIEVAVKSAIIDKISDAAWIVDNIQTPPVVEILTKYFPILFSDVNQFYEPTKERGIVKVIYEAVTIRNQMVHKGASPPKKEKVEEIINAVQDFLWG
jgi:hypothetical protein